MSTTIQAIYEHGLIRPLDETSLSEGEELEIILLTRKKKPDAAKILSEIAQLEMEGEMDDFSGQDHDKILYPIK
jgi:predicted DNA-binding antitoxin AbrB/MazE fold protein